MATITPKELAVRCDTDARTIRKFLRSEDGLNMRVGKGHRWAIEAKQVKSLKTRFARWDAARTVTEDEAPESDATPNAPETD